MYKPVEISTMSSKALKPCYGCNGEKIEYVQTIFGFRCRCYDCGTSSRTQPSLRLAIRKWNETHDYVMREVV